MRGKNKDMTKWTNTALTFAAGACVRMSCSADAALSGSRHAMVTSAPSWASRMAVSLPSPVLPPVMTAACHHTVAIKVTRRGGRAKGGRAGGERERGGGASNVLQLTPNLSCVHACKHNWIKSKNIAYQFFL